jgi:hypothetical protein
MMSKITHVAQTCVLFVYQCQNVSLRQMILLCQRGLYIAHVVFCLDRTVAVCSHNQCNVFIRCFRRNPIVSLIVLNDFITWITVPKELPLKYCNSRVDNLLENVTELYGCESDVTKNRIYYNPLCY